MWSSLATAGQDISLVALLSILGEGLNGRLMNYSELCKLESVTDTSPEGQKFEEAKND